MNTSELEITMFDRITFAAQHMMKVEYEHAGKPCRVHWQDSRGQHVTEGLNLFQATENAIAGLRNPNSIQDHQPLLNF